MVIVFFLAYQHLTTNQTVLDPLLVLVLTVLSHRLFSYLCLLRESFISSYHLREEW